MKWPGPVVEGRLIKRYKRFLADVRLESGEQITAHCANTGSMKTCMAPDAPCLLTHHNDPKRKLKYSWQAVQLEDGWVGINTSLANHLVREAVEANLVPALTGYTSLRAEQKYGKNSRIDLLLEADDRPACFVEVKNVTLLLEPGVAAFPDAVTARGTKHLEEMRNLVAEGKRAVLFFCVQRTSVFKVVPAEVFDPTYAQTLREAVANGVEVMAWQVDLNQNEVVLRRELPVVLSLIPEQSQ